jgi:hypothetical protein
MHQAGAYEVIGLGIHDSCPDEDTAGRKFDWKIEMFGHEVDFWMNGNEAGLQQACGLRVIKAQTPKSEWS